MTISFYQQNICWENPQANFEKVRRAFENVQADILVVPETFNTGFGDTMAALAEPPEGPTYEFACQMARGHNALFVGTWTVREPDGVYNRLHWVYPDGKYGTYDKAHTFRMSSEASQLQRGTHQETFEFRGWRIKPAICYDLRFPKWLRNKQTAPDCLDYDLMVVCANWPGSRHAAWTTLLQARAIENLSYVVGVNRVGIDGADIPYTGHSAAFDCKGLQLAACTPGQDEVATVCLDRESLQTFRSHWPFYLDFD